MTDTPELGNWLAVQVVAHRLQLSRMTVLRLIEEGHLAASNVGTGGEKKLFRVSEASVIAFLENTRVSAKESA